MLQPLVDRFMERKPKLLEAFRKDMNYQSILKEMITIISDEYGDPDPERITCIDHGEYQGTLLFIIGARGYQPDDYYCTRVSYGSCSSCDTLEHINTEYGWDDESWDKEKKKVKLDTRANDTGLLLCICFSI